MQHQKTGTNTKGMDIQALRLQRLASLLLDYGGDLRELEKDPRFAGCAPGVPTPIS